MASNCGLNCWDLTCPTLNKGVFSDYPKDMIEEAKELNQDDRAIYRFYEEKLRAMNLSDNQESTANINPLKRWLTLKLSNQFRERIYIPVERKAFSQRDKLRP